MTTNATTEYSDSSIKPLNMFTPKATPFYQYNASDGCYKIGKIGMPVIARIRL